jgi:hypothetical protein
MLEGSVDRYGAGSTLITSQLPVEACGVTEIVGQWPTDTGLTRPAQARPGSGRADPEARCDLTLGKAGG